MPNTRRSIRTHRIAALAATAALATTGAAGVAHATANPDVPTNTAPIVKERYPSPTPTVTNARFGRHVDFDRAVFDISGKAPGYSVRYLSSQPRECASGNKVYPQGTHFLQITLEPARTHDGNGKDAYAGPGQTQSAVVGLPAIRGMRVNCQFEGQVGVVLGLSHKAGFRVGTLSGPARIYVDVSH